MSRPLLQVEDEPQRALYRTPRVRANPPQAAAQQEPMHGRESGQSYARGDLQAGQPKFGIVGREQVLRGWIDALQTARDEGENDVVADRTSDDQTRAALLGGELHEWKRDENEIAALGCGAADGRLLSPLAAQPAHPRLMPLADWLVILIRVDVRFVSQPIERATVRR